MSEELTATINQVSEAVQSTAETAQKSSENTETIKERIYETTKAIEQVAITAQNQADLAEKLANQHMINAYDNMVKNGLYDIYKDEKIK